METSEILKKVRKIEIKTKGLSQNIFAGQYHSAFKGRGMAFAEVREYQFGDDVVENGTLPDGEKYDWSKAHRAGMRPAKE